MAKFMVAISYREGVVLSEKYTKLDGQYFKGLVWKENFRTRLSLIVGYAGTRKSFEEI